MENKTSSVIKNTYVIHHNRMSKMDKLALFVTERIGTMGFFFILLIWTLIWLVWNLLVPNHLRFDPYPAYVILLLVSNLIQLLLLPLLLISQNLQNRHAEIRAEHEYQTNLKVEQEIEHISDQLKKQQETLTQVLQKVAKLEAKSK